MPTYDAMIFAARKDYHKVPLAVASLRWLHPQPEGVYIVSPDGYMPSGTGYDDRLVRVFDKEIMPDCDRSRFKWRPNWCFQNLAKLMQDVTEQDWYLGSDADNFFVKPLSLFSGERGRFFMSPQHSGYHPPYWNFNRELFGLGRVAPDRLIMDFMLYHKGLARTIFADYQNLTAFFERCYEIIDIHCHPAEQELYSNWCLRHHPGSYELVVNVPTRLLGKTPPDDWTAEEIRAILGNPQVVGDAIAVTCHSWWDDP